MQKDKRQTFVKEDGGLKVFDVSKDKSQSKLAKKFGTARKYPNGVNNNMIQKS